MPYVLSPRDLVFRPDIADINFTTTIALARKYDEIQLCMCSVLQRYDIFFMKLINK